MSKPNWSRDLIQAIQGASTRGPADEYLEPNVQSAKQVARGLGPDSDSAAVAEAGAGARIVFNMSCRYVKDFCDLGATYQNAYERGTVGNRRQGVDKSVEQAALECNVQLAPRDIYFGAVETSGSGIRFYGDMCLVLKTQPAFVNEPQPGESTAGPEDPLLILSRNSYDVIRAPAADTVNRAVQSGYSHAQRQAEHLLGWMGSWEEDLLSVIAIKVLEQLPRASRRWTTGQIAQAVLNDEDYIEVLYSKPFSTRDLLEVRLSATEVAAEAEIAAREATGESPLPEEAEWREQRREARRALARSGVPVHVVVTSGRIKSA